MQYDKKSYCQYLIELHLILVVKYRKQLLVGHLGKFVKTLLSNYQQNQKIYSRARLAIHPSD
ncbi:MULTISPECIES: transposase [Pseudoalteromonas]|uniref:transposase n=1 Tax=Pseudoalteromonas TaxID=53246 RepID=UPI001787E520|nr:transposase [Pseudoalteromonas nigrifaciens]